MITPMPARTPRSTKPKKPDLRAQARNLVDNSDEDSAALPDGILREALIDATEPSVLGDDGLAAAIKLLGATPGEFLAMVYRNPWQKMADRISAAKALLEYNHRKLPSKVEVSTPDGIGVRSLDAAALAKLSEKELGALEKILEKIS